MNWKQHLTSPPPTTSWTLDGAVIAGLRRDPKGGVLWAAETTPEGAFEAGPVGLQSVDRRKLLTVLGSIHGRLDGARRAAVVVPSAWTRSYRLEFPELPSRHGELEQVVRWRLKKLLPVPPADLRMSLVPLPPGDGPRPLLAMVAIERAVAELEAAFAEVGVELGMLTGRNFALAASGGATPRLLVQQEQGFLSLLLVQDAVLRLIRTKPLAAAGRLGDIVRRELSLTLGYIRGTIGLKGEVVLDVSAESAELAAEIEEWRERQPGVTRGAAAAPPPFTEGGAVDRLGMARIQPAWAVMTGVVQ